MDRRYDNEEEFFQRPREIYRYDPQTRGSGSRIVSLIGLLVIGIAIIYFYLIIDYYLEISLSLDLIPVMLGNMLRSNWYYIPALPIFMKYFSVPLTKHQIAFRAIGMRWKTTVAKRIMVRGDLDFSVVNSLQSIRNLTWYTYVDSKQESVTIMLEKTRRIFPVRTSTLASYLDNILLTNDVRFTSTKVPNLRHLSFMYVRSTHFFTDNQEICQRLEKTGLHFAFITQIRFSSMRYDPSRHLDEPEYQTTIGFWCEDYEKIIPYLYSMGHETRVIFRRLYQYSQKDRDLSALILVWRIVFLDRLARRLSFMHMGGKKALRLMQIPYFGEQTAIALFKAPRINSYDDYTFGTILDRGQQAGKFGLTIPDFEQGGLITGAIGTGKTTLRLHLMKYLVQNQIRIIDFDLKGDATKYPEIVRSGKIVVPNENFQMNPFSCPRGFSATEYGDIILQSFMETIPQGEEMSPPQRYLLNRAVHKTIKEGGNSRDFFENIMITANQQKDIIDNKQETSALALLIKFDWMQSTFRDIFWKDESSILYSEYSSRSLFFDLSKLASVATTAQIQFLINLVTAKIMSTLRNEAPKKFNQVIFLDEAQLLMPRTLDFQGLTKLEQTIATLRYKGVAVIAAGISAQMMSAVLRDVGFIAQFRTESDALEHALSLSDKPGLLPELEDYKVVIKSKSTQNRPVIIQIDPFGDQAEIIKHELSIKQDLGDFELDFESYWRMKLNAAFSEYLNLKNTHMIEVKAYARVFVDQEITTFSTESEAVRKLIMAAKKRVEEMIAMETIEPIAIKYPREFFYMILYAYLMRFIQQLQFDPKLNLIERNLDNIIHSTTQYIDTIIQDMKPRTKTVSFNDLRSLIKLMESGNGLSKYESSAFIINTISAIEYILKILLRIQEGGMYELITEARKQKLLSNRESQILDQFRIRIRNPYVHGQLVDKHIQLGLVYEAAKIIIELTDQHQKMIQHSSPIYRINSK